MYCCLLEAPLKRFFLFLITIALMYRTSDSFSFSIQENLNVSEVVL